MDTSDSPLDDEDFADLASIALQGTGFPFDGILAAHPEITDAFVPFDPVHTAAIFGGLLTVPELQSNCCRLEALAHVAVALSNGNKRPSKSAVTAWFDELSGGPCGRYEDPAEDAFTSLVTTSRGNFRILEGTWESAGFYLQRIVNVVEGMPTTGRWATIREGVFALLKLSDLICERSRLPRYSFASESRFRRLPKHIADNLPKFRQRITFSHGELRAHQVTIEDLSHFIFNPELRGSIPTSSLTHSPLIRYPLLEHDGQLIVALPSAISVAIRMYVIGGLMNSGHKTVLLEAIAEEYRVFFAENPPFGAVRGAPIAFRATDNGVLASYAHEVDEGRYLQVIFVLDTLDGFDHYGFAGTSADAFALTEDLGREVSECRHAIHERQNFREGLTVIVGCGIGRSASFVLERKDWTDWQTVHLTAADVATLGWLSIGPLTLWRILDAQARLTAQGVQLINANGLPNLIAWVRSLDGHVVPHSQMPIEFGAGGICRMIIPTDCIRDLRREVAVGMDRHAVASPTGSWTEIRKLNESYFVEDRLRPLYVSTQWDANCGLRMVFLTPTRHWWAEVAPLRYERWKLVTTWLPRIASVLDVHLPDLPTGAVSLTVNFQGLATYDSEPATVVEDEIYQGIKVTVDRAQHRVALETNEAFERGLAMPTNIAEAAFVRAAINGFMALSGQTSDERERCLQAKIVANPEMRDAHCFHVRHFRDFVLDSIAEKPLTIDAIDDASNRLGLGWMIRNRDIGSAIEGKTACTAFLNALVRSIEDELCLELQAFDRQSLIARCLNNHEAAVVQQNRWRRTAAAIMALHDDKSAAMATIAEKEFDNSAAMQASRVLIELAVCECPLQGGKLPGELDLSRLMAKLMSAIGYGGWSDAIHDDAMTPSLEITPLGDIHADQSFFRAVIIPFGHVSHGTMVNDSIENYSRNYEKPKIVGAVEPAFEPEFVAAWKEEREFPFDDIRRFVDQIEDDAISKNQSLLTMRRSELAELLGNCIPDGLAIADSLTTVPRSSWRAVPAGYR